MDGEAWIPDTRRLAPLDAAFRDDESGGGAACESEGCPGAARHICVIPEDVPCGARSVCPESIP
jgi:hypothetical protein